LIFSYQGLDLPDSLHVSSVLYSLVHSACKRLNVCLAGCSWTFTCVSSITTQVT
jgi:hypothetical protein